MRQQQKNPCRCHYQLFCSKSISQMHYYEATRESNVIYIAILETLLRLYPYAYLQYRHFPSFVGNVNERRNSIENLEMSGGAE